MNNPKAQAIHDLKLSIAAWRGSIAGMEARAALRAEERRAWLETEDGARRYRSMVYSATKRVKRASVQVAFLLGKLRELETGGAGEIAAALKREQDLDAAIAREL